MTNRERYEYRKSNGLCTHCGKKSRPNRTKCQRCEARELASQAKRYKKRIADRVCKCKRKLSGQEALCRQCADKQNVSNKERRKKQKAKGICYDCRSKTRNGRTLCERCLEKYSQKNQATKRETFEAYGGCLCSCCREDHFEFLELDHINGGGGDHRKLVGGGSPFYIWLRKRGYPAGYRVLCANCNASLGRYGYCPHGTVGPKNSLNHRSRTKYVKASTANSGQGRIKS